VDPEINAADQGRAIAVLLHPHPHFGGNRFHPFVEGLFRRLPGIGVTAIRFDFSSAEFSIAGEEAVAAIDEGATRWPHLPVIVAGYSFGAGIASSIGDERIAGWYLLAPPSEMLSASTVGDDPRPKAIVVPEFDQFSPPATIARVVTGWQGTTITTVPNADHFLGAVQPIVDGALRWIERITNC
jgi:alpha/beta superfamily hydrolase